MNLNDIEFRVRKYSYMTDAELEGMLINLKASNNRRSFIIKLGFAMVPITISIYGLLLNRLSNSENNIDLILILCILAMIILVLSVKIIYDIYDKNLDISTIEFVLNKGST